MSGKTVDFVSVRKASNYHFDCLLYFQNRTKNTPCWTFAVSRLADLSVWNIKIFVVSWKSGTKRATISQGKQQKANREGTGSRLKRKLLLDLEHAAQPQQIPHRKNCKGVDATVNSFIYLVVRTRRNWQKKKPGWNAAQLQTISILLESLR